MANRLLSLSLGLAIVVSASGCNWLHAKEAKQEKPVLAVIHLETFVVNLADDGQRTFLRVGIDLGVVAEKKTKESEIKPVAPMRDVILGVLMATNSEDLATSDGKQKLKEQILKALNDKLPELQTREVYFTEFLLQQ